MSMSLSTKPYRLLVWGPGGLGRVAIKEIALKPEFELVGVLAFAEGNGKQLDDLNAIVHPATIARQASTMRNNCSCRNPAPLGR